MKKILSIAALTLATLAAASPNKVSPDLQAASGDVDIVVRYASAPTTQSLNKVKAKGGKLKRSLASINGVQYHVPATALAELASDPDVVYISPDRPLQAKLDLTTAATGAAIGWQSGWTGKGIGIAIIDSGISNSADLASTRPRVVYEETFGPLSPTDEYGHGTHVAGIVAGNGSLSNGKYAGIAPEANLIDLRVLDKQGRGTDSAVIEAIGRAIELKDRFNIRVINLSLGRPVYESYTEDPLCQAVEAAWKAGIVVVAAAGNDGRNNTFGNNGYATINSPANDPYVITVGAMKTMGTPSRSDDLIASYSSKGPTAIDHIVKPDLVAPGNAVVSTMAPGQNYLLQNYPGNRVGALYFRLSGTSMAAPVVSGAAALLTQKDPSLTPDQIKARLMRTAGKTFPASSTAYDPATGTAYQSQYDIFTVGAGYVDIAAALADATPSSKAATSPVVQYDPATGTVRLVTDSSLVWGSSIVWGNSVVWGGFLEMDGWSLVWGSGAATSTSVVWGESIVWGDFLCSDPISLMVNGEN